MLNIKPVFIYKQVLRLYVWDVEAAGSNPATPTKQK